MKKEKVCDIEHLKKYVLGLDIYGTEVKLNINGESRVNTFYGSILTMFTYLVIGAYGLNQFINLITRSTTTVTRTTIVNHFDYKNKVGFEQIGFKMAWALTTHDDAMDPKHNASFLYWQPVERSFDGMTNSRKNLGFHVCTPDELDSFDPISTAYTDVMARFRSSPTLLCLDDDF